MGFEERVRQRAYELWEQAGRPEGDGREFWERACDEIEQELLDEQDDTLDEAKRG